MLTMQCKAVGLPAPTPEFKFHETRKWRVDYAWPEIKLAVEIEGGVFMAGRHSRGAGFRNDLEKYNTLTIMGWSLLRFLPEQIKQGIAISTIERYFNERRG